MMFVCVGLEAGKYLLALALAPLWSNRLHLVKNARLLYVAMNSVLEINIEPV